MDSAESLPQGDSFARAGRMNSDRYAHTATLLDNGWVLITGGIDASAQILAMAELFIPRQP